MKLLARHLSFANAMSMIAVFIALGGSAFALTVGKNSVGSRQIKPNAVTSSELKNNSVTTPKIKNGAVTAAKLGAGSVTTAALGAGSVATAALGANSVTGAQIQNGAIGTADIAPGALANVPASNVISVSAEGVNCGQQGHVTPGVTATHVSTGICQFNFGRNVSACNAVASADTRLSEAGALVPGARTVYAFRRSNTPNVVSTTAYLGNPPALANLEITLDLVC